MNNFNGRKILAYITVYEDKAASLKCLEAIKLQTVSVDRILIVDNSAQQLLGDSDSSSTLIYHFPSNVGISRGLTLALERGLRENYDFLWAFDQDSVPNIDCLADLLEEYYSLIAKKYRVGIIAPIAFDSRSQLVIGGVNFKNDKFVHHKHNKFENIYECDAPITSGSLINLAAARLIDLPVSDLFIDGIDFDYGLTFKKKGFRNFVVTKAKLEHNYGIPINISILNFSWVFQSCSSLRYYYSCRNTTYLVLNYANGFYKVTAFFHRIKTTLLKILAIILFESDSKLEKVYACILGTYHGLVNKLGKTW